MLDLIAKISLVAMALNINTGSYKETLPIMAIGMVGIFLVIGVIVICTYGLNKVTSKNKNKEKDDK